MDKIDGIVARAIAYTDHVLATKPEHYRAARQGLERMRDNLARDTPGHPALERLTNYLGALDRRENNGGAR